MKSKDCLPGTETARSVAGISPAADRAPVINPLILHPDVVALQRDVAALRGELAALLAEKQNLLLVVKPNLLAFYQTTLGSWELRKLEGGIAIARLRRAITMAQAEKNRGMTPDWKEIEGFLDLEFLEWQAEVRKRSEEMARARAYLDAPTLSGKDTRRFNKLYRHLIRALHPDLNPKLDEEKGKLWLWVQSAYESGDLAEMERLGEQISPDKRLIPAADEPDPLPAEKKRLIGMIEKLVDEMDRLKKEFPFDHETNLADPLWIQEKRKELDDECALQAQRLDALRLVKESL